jgi:hypothetical protein
MNPINISFAGQNSDGLPSWALFGIGIALILWLWSVVVIAKEKTEDPYDRIVWLLIVLLLNFIGTLLYFFFAGDAKSGNEQIAEAKRDIKRRANEGRL